MCMEFGYARVSTSEQSVEAQHDALVAAGCERIVVEQASGRRADRPELARLLDQVRAGDRVTVVRLDRLGRSTSHLLAVTSELRSRGVAFRSLTEALDTQSAVGSLVFQVLAALAEFEASLIRERTLEGLAAARRRGRTGGRPPVLTPAKQQAMLRLLDGGSTVVEAARALGISKSTAYRYLRTQPEAA